MKNNYYIIDRPYVTCENTTDDIVLDQVFSEFDEDVDFVKLHMPFRNDDIKRGWRGDLTYWIMYRDIKTCERPSYKPLRKWNDVILIQAEPVQPSRDGEWIYTFSKSHLK